jgi:hypothetical protein
MEQEERSPPQVVPASPLLNGLGGQRSGGTRLFQSVAAEDALYRQPPAKGLSQPRKHAGQSGGRHTRRSRFALPHIPMSQPRRNSAFHPLDDTLFAVKQRKPVPHEFVLDAIAPVSPETRSMFGCLAIYVQDRIVLILRDKRDQKADNGVWLATTEEHHQSLRREFPTMRSIQVLGKKVTGWQVLPADAQDFEQAALHACELVLAGDPRIGKVPGARRASGSGAKKAAKSSKRAKAPRTTAKARARS